MGGRASAARAETRILVVDDDRTVTRILRSMLEIEGYVVAEAWSGVGLADRIAADPPALILLDLHMPQVSGVEVLTAVRARLGAAVPVVMLTGESDDSPLRAALGRQGVDSYLVKPVAMEKLHATVRATLEAHELRLAVERLRGELAARGDELARAHQALDLVAEGVALVDRDLRVAYANRAFSRLAGAAGGSPVGRRLGEILPSPALASSDLEGLCRAHGGAGSEVELVGGGGAARRVRLRVALVAGAPARAFVFVSPEAPEPRSQAEETAGKRPATR